MIFFAYLAPIYYLTDDPSDVELKEQHLGIAGAVWTWHRRNCLTWWGVPATWSDFVRLGRRWRTISNPQIERSQHKPCLKDSQPYLSATGRISRYYFCLALKEVLKTQSNAFKGMCSITSRHLQKSKLCLLSLDVGGHWVNKVALFLSCSPTWTQCVACETPLPWTGCGWPGPGSCLGRKPRPSPFASFHKPYVTP